MGRPRLPKGVKKDSFLMVALRPAEAYEFRRLASGNVSATIRELILVALDQTRAQRKHRTLIAN